MQNGKNYLAQKEHCFLKGLVRDLYVTQKPKVRSPLPETCYDNLILRQCGINAGHRFRIFTSEVYDICVFFALRL